MNSLNQLIFVMVKAAHTSPTDCFTDNVEDLQLSYTIRVPAVLLWRKSTNGYRRSSYLAYLPRYRNYLHHTSNRLILNEPFLTAAVTWTSF